MIPLSCLGLSFLTLSMPLPWRTFPQHTRGAKVPVATQARIRSQDERIYRARSFPILILIVVNSLRLELELEREA